MNRLPSTIQKRDGRNVGFDIGKVQSAIERCFKAIGKGTQKVDQIVEMVANTIAARTNSSQPNVEGVQDIVEMVLQAAGEFDAAKHYILYRADHARKRDERPIPDAVRRAFDASDEYFPSPIQKFQFFDKYSRYNYNLGRRETWVETVDRTMDFLYELAGGSVATKQYSRMRKAILEMRVMPSMRLLAMAGDATRRSNITMYNCSYLPVSDIDCFVEALIVSMCGCGVGYSVERKYVEQFPRIARQNNFRPIKYVIEDTSEGWANALRVGLNAWFDGRDMDFDFSHLRPSGAPLRTKGGRASGPDPLRLMLDFIRNRILARQGSFLRSIDAHDIMCAIGNASICGGVRRTALISLIDYDDMEMRTCKEGNFEHENKQRWNANNSVVWPDGSLTQIEFVQQFSEMARSGRGEPGIFNREVANTLKPNRRKEADFGSNPCGEVVLLPFQFCNLSSVISRSEDTFETLKEKVEIATMIGTIQSLATDFPGLRHEWKRNCEEERLLGIDITGQMDCQVVQSPEVQDRLLEHALIINQRTADRMGINRSAAISCVKPSGNSSELVGCSPGIHARWAKYYIRNIRVSSHSPLYRVLRNAGAPMHPENGQTPESATTWVIHFPVKSPEGSVIRTDRTAIQQCEYWLQTKLHWTEHNPSCTIMYKPEELIELMGWVWSHAGFIGGLTFLPIHDAHYKQMPYTEISKEEYEQLSSSFPEIDYSKVYRYEESDLTNAAQEVSCFAGQCELV